MAEDNNQDMAMEDILSSIKNILEEDEAGRIAEKPLSEEPLIDEAEEVNVDDILELSPDMMINDAIGTEVTEPVAENINLEAELNEVNVPELPSETDFQINDSESQGVQANVGLGWEDFESDPLDAETKVSSAEDLIENDDTVLSAEKSSPALAAEEEPITSSIKEDTTAVEESTIDLASEIENQPEPNIERSSEQVFEAEKSEEQKPVAVSEAELSVTQVSEEQASDAVDVSASIISNFTKMFSRAEPKAEPIPVEEVPAEPVKVIGDGSKTIEDIVSDVIRRIIGAEVEKNWRIQADYDTYAREVIATQTKAWLDANIPYFSSSLSMKRDFAAANASLTYTIEGATPKSVSCTNSQKGTVSGTTVTISSITANAYALYFELFYFCLFFNVLKAAICCSC